MSTAVRSRVFKISAAAVTAAIAIGLCLFSQDDVSASIKERRVERLNAQIENVYTDEYQQMMDTEIADERDAKERTVDSIYTKVNPYGTNTTSMYVYFTTDQASTVSYTVSAEGYPDYTANAITSDEAAAAYREAAAGDADGSGNVVGTSTASQTTTVSSNDIASTEHEFLVLGLIPKVKNTITLTITDTDGNATTRTIEQTGPKLLGEEEVRLEQAIAPDESTVTTLGNGLYAILGNDSNEVSDANGVGGEIPVLYYRSHRLLFDNDGIIWFSASTKHFVGMNRLGKLVKIINLGDQYILHHDYALDSDGNIVSLATDLKHSDHAVQDQVIKVDTDSGEVSLLVDFGDLFPDYKQSTDHSGIDESDPTATNRWDWIHFNTIPLMDDGSALLSARETSTMIKINDIEGTPSLDYMIGEPSVWNGMDAQPSFLTKVGDSGDRRLTSTIPRFCHIYMFDNDFGYAMTRPDFDWTMIDGISTAQSSKDENNPAASTVDENAEPTPKSASMGIRRMSPPHRNCPMT